ncbi:MAG: potassium-transporting ATPase subunit KdpA [Meiothermus silvanus]|nr:potassium-transporting ATPase subunit KdpA [Allomeiothermus silvanus]
MTEVILILLLVLLLAWPLGGYLARVFSGERTLLDFLAPLERGIYRLLGVNPERGMDWRGYAKALLGSNLLLALAAYGVLVLQGKLPLNPDGVPSMSWHLALHTVASFITNTNQQHYSGQAQLSYLAQMLAITALQLITPAAGLATLVAILRALRPPAGRKAGDLGNYYVDVTRALTRVLIPLSVAWALLLTWQGVPSTFSGAKVAELLEPQTLTVEGKPQTVREQVIPVGPVAAMVAIKQLGTNGGGWYGPNSAFPLENPTPFSNLLETVAILLLPVAQVFMIGHVLRNLAFARLVFGVMAAFSVLFIAFILPMEQAPNPAFAQLAAPGPNWEGKELRLGPLPSALWATLTTQASNGSVNAMHDSLQPLSILIALVDMFINATWGGVGVGAINFLLYVVLAVFIAGLMVGRTPELFGKKLEAREIKLASIAILLQPLLVLVPTALALGSGLANTSNPGFHGLSQVLYEYTSAYANNGSGLAGLGNTTVWWNLSCAVVLILARYIPMIAPLAIAAFLAAKRTAPQTVGTLRTETPTFGLTVFSIIVIVQGLNFFPYLILGPIAEQLVGVR